MKPDKNTKMLARKLMQTLPGLGHVIASAMRSILESDLNTMMQAHTLRILSEKPLTFKELVAYRRVAPPTLSRSIDAMARRGWVERAPHPTDRRQVLLQLTDAGHAEFKMLESKLLEKLAERLAHLTKEEQQTVSDAFDALLRVFGNELMPPFVEMKRGNERTEKSRSTIQRK
jgi:DNA-binding MarR family transcriptional regulator